MLAPQLRRLILVLLVAGPAAAPSARAGTPCMTCLGDPPRLTARSQELAAIVKADQDDRNEWEKKSAEHMAAVTQRDVARRKRVGEIFGEGCFSKAEDYAAAALVFQHGDVPDHFFQTFLWSKRAVELGDSKQSRLMAFGIDRYLVNTGRKQLFGSQASKPDLKPETCWCLEQVERAYPDRLRAQHAGKTLAEAREWLNELNAGKSCVAASWECNKALKASPRGTVAGFW